MPEGSEMKKKRSLWTVGAVVLFEPYWNARSGNTNTQMFNKYNATYSPSHCRILMMNQNFLINYFLYGQVNFSGSVGPTDC